MRYSEIQEGAETNPFLQELRQIQEQDAEFWAQIALSVRARDANVNHLKI